MKFMLQAVSIFYKQFKTCNLVQQNGENKTNAFLQNPSLFVTFEAKKRSSCPKKGRNQAQFEGLFSPNLRLVWISLTSRHAPSILAGKRFLTSAQDRKPAVENLRHPG
jgi:hypothetical protein